MVIIVFGLPGSGKTYFAKALAEKMKASHNNTDLLRKKLLARPLYTKEEREYVYTQLLDNISNTKDLILDGTFFKKALRQAFIDKAIQKSVSLKFIEIRASEGVIRKRISKPRTDSDADMAVYNKIRKEFEEMPEEHLVLYSDIMKIEEMIDKSIKYLYPSSV